MRVCVGGGGGAVLLMVCVCVELMDWVEVVECC